MTTRQTLTAVALAALAAALGVLAGQSTVAECPALPVCAECPSVEPEPVAAPEPAPAPEAPAVAPGE